MKRTILLAALLAVAGCDEEEAGVWQRELGWGAASSPVVGPNGVVYFGAKSVFGGGAWLQAYTPSGKLRWDREGGRAVVADDGLLYSVTGPLVYALDPSDGEVQWYAEAGGEIAVRSDGWVFSTWRTAEQQRLGKSTLAGVDPYGRLAWQQEAFGSASAPLVDAEGTVWFALADAAGNNRMLGFDRDGAERYEIPLEGAPTSVALHRNGEIYVGGAGFLRIIREPTGEGVTLQLNHIETGAPLTVSGMVIGEDDRVYANTDLGLGAFTVKGDTPGGLWLNTAVSGGIAASRDGKLHVTRGTELVTLQARSGKILRVWDHFSITHTVGPPALADGRIYVAGHFFLSETFFGANNEFLGAENSFRGWAFGHGGGGGPANSGWYRSGDGNNGGTRSAPVPKAKRGEPSAPLGPEADFGRFEWGEGSAIDPTVVEQLADGRLLAAGGGSIISRPGPGEREGLAPVRAQVGRVGTWLALRDESGWTKVTYIDVADEEDRDRVPYDEARIDAATQLADGTIVVAGRVAGTDGALHSMVAFDAELRPLWHLDLPDEMLRMAELRATATGLVAAGTRPNADFGEDRFVAWFTGGSAQRPPTPSHQTDFENETYSRFSGLTIFALGADGRAFVIGATNDQADFGDGPIELDPSGGLAIVALDPDGEQAWYRVFPGGASVHDAAVGPGGELGFGGALYRDTNFGQGVLAGPEGALEGNWSGFVAVLGPDGEGRWSRRAGENVGAAVDAVAFDDHGQLAVTGYLGTDFETAGRRFSTRGAGFVAMQFDPEGRPLWARPTYTQRFLPARAWFREGDLVVFGQGSAAYVGFGTGAIDLRFEAVNAARARADFAGTYWLRLRGAGDAGGQVEQPDGPVGEGERIEVDVDGPGRVVSDPAGIDCPGQCEADFPSLGEVTLRAVPDADGHFARWTDGPCEGAPECSFALQGPTEVEVEFAHPGVGWHAPLPDGFGLVSAAGVEGGYVVLASITAGTAFELPDLSGTAQNGDFALLGYDAEGALAWSRTVSDATPHSPGRVATAPDGGFVYAGVSQGGPIDLGTGPLEARSQSDLVLARFDAAGQPRWVKRFGAFVGPGIDDLDVAADGLIAIAGARTLGGDFDGVEVPATDAPWFGAFAEDGSPRWLRSSPGGYAQSVAALPGGAVAVGFGNPTGADIGRGPEMSANTAVLARYDSGGNLLAARAIPIGSVAGAQRAWTRVAGLGADVAFAVSTDARDLDLDGHMFPGDNAGLLGRWDAGGGLPWVRALSEDDQAHPMALAALPDDRLVSLSEATGPYGDPSGRRRRHQGAMLNVHAADGTLGWSLPAWLDEMENPGLGPSGVATGADGSLLVWVPAATAQIYLGASLEPGTWLFQLRP